MSKIFGIGLPRTGTKSLCKALIMLGVKACHNPRDEITIKQLKSGDYKLKVLETCEAITDLPAACFYKEYDKLYPNSKFIYTTREKDKWLESCNRWWQFTEMRTLEEVKHKDQVNNCFVFLMARMFGCLLYNKEVFARLYDSKLLEIKYYFKDRLSDLLILDIDENDKWSLLCPFLNKKVINKVYPCMNNTNYLEKEKAKAIFSNYVI